MPSTFTDRENTDDSAENTIHKANTSKNQMKATPNIPV